MEIKEINVIGVLLRLTDGDNVGCFALQKRSSLNESFHYVLQETWVGKMEEGENEMEAVKRECKEELGELFFNSFDFSTLNFIGNKTNEVTGKKYLIHNYIGEISENMLKKAVLHEGALPEFIYINKESLIFPMSSGKDPGENLVVFDDQYEVLTELLKNGN